MRSAASRSPTLRHMELTKGMSIGSRECSGPRYGRRQSLRTGGASPPRRKRYAGGLCGRVGQPFWPPRLNKLPWPLELESRVSLHLGAMSDRDFRLSPTVRPTRYALRIEANLQEWSFRGSERIELTVQQPTNEIVVHSVDLDIKTCRVLAGTYAFGGPHFLSAENVERIHTRPDEAYRRRELHIR